MDPPGHLLEKLTIALKLTDNTTNKLILDITNFLKIKKLYNHNITVQQQLLNSNYWQKVEFYPHDSSPQHSRASSIQPWYHC